MYSIRITATAKGQLAKLDRRTQMKIASRIDELKNEPEKRGKSLQGSLHGYRSLRAARQRYRIIYRVLDDIVLVLVVSTGIRREGDRKDVYQLMKKLIRSGLLD